MDSPNGFVRAIERWKRGFGLLFVVALFCLAGLIIYALADWLLSATPLSEAWQKGIALMILIAYVPWILGDRSILRELGKLAALKDD
jgi:hypothetical protein